MKALNKYWKPINLGNMSAVFDFHWLFSILVFFLLGSLLFLSIAPLMFISQCHPLAKLAIF